jgi:subtilisin family serine protease
MAQGVSTVLSNQSGNIVTAQGTSFSSPVTAGVVACLWQALPNKTNQQIKDLIIQSADRYLVPDNQYGYGIPDFGLALENGLVIENMAREYFVAYPNPTTDFVTVDFPEGFNSGTVIFYSALGKKVLEKQVNNEQDRFSLNSLSRGVYFYKIENDTFSKKGKIIKQ